MNRLQRALASILGITPAEAASLLTPTSPEQAPLPPPVVDPRAGLFVPGLKAAFPDGAAGKVTQAIKAASLGGVSLESTGYTLKDHLPGGRANPRPGQAQAATTVTDGVLPLPTAPSAPTNMIARSISPIPVGENGEVIQNWQFPRWVRPSTPLLEIVNNRVIRSQVSHEYYSTDGVCGPAIDILAEFPLNRGYSAEPVYTADEFPLWFDPAWVPADSLVDAQGNSTIATAVTAWLRARNEELTDDLNLVYEMIQLQISAYLDGDGFINRVDYVEDEGFRTDNTRIYPNNTILNLQGLNSSAVWLERDILGRMIGAVIMPPAGSSTHAQQLDLEHLIHLKHKGHSYTTYGMPHTMRVIRELRVKTAYLDAAHAWGQRYSVPIRMLKYGLVVRGGEMAGPIANDEMRAAAEAAIAEYDPSSGQTIVAPFHWEYSFVGADGSNAMAVSNELMEANRRIMAGLEVPSAFLYGDWTNYATARIQYSGLMHRLKTIQEGLKRILERRIFLPLYQMRGYVDNLGQPIRVIVTWKRGHLEDDQGYMDFIATMAAQAGVLSLKSLRESIGFDSEVEDQNLDQEAERYRKRINLIRNLEMAPSQSPALLTGPGYQDPNPDNLPDTQPWQYQEHEQVILTRLQQGLQKMTQRVDQLTTQAAATLGVLSLQHATAAEIEKAERSWVMQVRQAKAMVAAFQRRLDDLPPAYGTLRILPQTATASTPTFTGTMIACFIPREVASRMAVPNGEATDDLHVTLAYLPTLTDEQRGRLHGVLSNLAQTHHPLTGTLSGVNRFVGVEDGTQDAVYMGVDVLGLTELREEVCQLLDALGVEVSRRPASQYTPHVTLAYVPTGAEDPMVPTTEHAVTFRHLSLAQGPTRHHYVLGAGA